jgi:hypothetical protein
VAEGEGLSLRQEQMLDRPRHRLPHPCRGPAHNIISGPGSPTWSSCGRAIHIDSRVYTRYRLPPKLRFANAKIVT